MKIILPLQKRDVSYFVDLSQLLLLHWR